MGTPNSAPWNWRPSRSGTLYGRSRRHAGCQSRLVARLEIGDDIPDEDAQDNEDECQQELLEHQYLPGLAYVRGPCCSRSCVLDTVARQLALKREGADGSGQASHVGIRRS
jgi:hypothetical protein